MAVIYTIGDASNLGAGSAALSATGDNLTSVWPIGTTVSLVAGSALIVSSAAGRQLIRDVGTTVSLQAQAASVFTPSGVLIEDIGAVAELIAQSAVLSGQGKPAKFGSGGLAAQRAAVATVESITRVGTGALLSQSAQTYGVSERMIVTADGSLEAQMASVGGVYTKTVVAAGGLIAAPAVGAGAGIRVKKVAAALAGDRALASGWGGHSTSLGPVGSGDLVCADAILTNATIVNKFASGALLASAAVVEGSGGRAVSAEGTLLSGRARVDLDGLSGDILTWEMDDAIWGQPSVIHARDWPVFPQGTNFFQMDMGRYFDNEPVRVVLERTGLSILGRDRQGNWKVDQGVIKFISGVWPYFKGTPGTEILIYVGSQMNVEEAVTWEGPYRAVIGETEFLDFTVSGRYIAVRFESVGQQPWELISYDLELTTVGER